MRSYRVLITADILRLQRPSRRQRDAILGFIDGLQSQPYTQGDYTEKDETGRPIHIKIIGGYALSFWADHAVCEVKVTRIEKAD